jgi:hypothetical protein
MTLTWDNRGLAEEDADADFRSSVLAECSYVEDGRRKGGELSLVLVGVGSMDRHQVRHGCS